MPSTTNGTTDPHGFLYQDGTMLDLNNLIPPDTGWTIDDAYAINDNGWIAATGTNPNVNSGSRTSPPPHPRTRLPRPPRLGLRRSPDPTPTHSPIEHTQQ